MFLELCTDQDQSVLNMDGTSNWSSGCRGCKIIGGCNLSINNMGCNTDLAKTKGGKRCSLPFWYTVTNSTACDEP
jgi:hypothetical protein